MKRNFSFLIWIFALALSLCHCSQRLLRADPSLEPKYTDGHAAVEVPLSLHQVGNQLEAYLKNRERLENIHAEKKKIFLQQTWQRDQSLRYYFLDFDKKTRHWSEWKSLWTLTAISPTKTQIKVETLEILFIGSPKFARGGPASKKPINPKAQQNWFEAPPDRVRSAFELRRSIKSQYPKSVLPPWLADYKVPELKGLSQTLRQEMDAGKWQTSPARESF